MYQKCEHTLRSNVLQFACMYFHTMVLLKRYGFSLHRFSEMLEQADDMAIDVPFIWLYLAEMLSPLLREGGMSMRELFRSGMRKVLWVLFGAFVEFGIKGHSSPKTHLYVVLNEHFVLLRWNLLSKNDLKMRVLLKLQLKVKILY